MKLSKETLLAANELIHRRGDSAEEYVAKQLSDSRKKEFQKGASQWLEMTEALKWVRELRAKIAHGS
jgi:hypothetical protein